MFVQRQFEPKLVLTQIWYANNHTELFVGLFRLRAHGLSPKFRHFIFSIALLEFAERRCAKYEDIYAVCTHDFLVWHKN